MMFRRFSPIGRRAGLIAGVILSTVACTDDATAPGTIKNLPEKISAVDNPDLIRISDTPPVVNGAIGKAEYSGAAVFRFMARVPSGPFLTVTTPVTVYATHDTEYLYLAATFDRKTPIHPMDHVAFEFDNDNDGAREDGDDIIMMYAQGPMNIAQQVVDLYRYNNGAYAGNDTADGGTNDAVGAWGVVGTKAVFELRKPLDGMDDAHDVTLRTMTGGDSAGLQTMIALESGPIGSLNILRTFHPSFTTYCKLTIATKTVDVSCP